MLLCKPTALVEISTKSSAYKSKFSREPLGKVMGSKPWVFSNLEGILNKRGDGIQRWSTPLL